MHYMLYLDLKRPDLGNCTLNRSSPYSEVSHINEVLLYLRLLMNHKKKVHEKIKNE